MNVCDGLCSMEVRPGDNAASGALDPSAEEE
jgi:hypothetical protein